MSEGRTPILLSYYALVNDTDALIFGQLTSKRLRDLSFTSFSRRTTFRTLLSIYRSKPLSNRQATLHYGSLHVDVTTDASGFFLIRTDIADHHLHLQRVTVDETNVKLIDGLYDKGLHRITTPDIVVSDIDDTILHSFISKKLRKLKTLMFTPVERRLAVEPTKNLINEIVARGATAFYLSNSEQNLYPLIYRFLLHNAFPKGPVFLKQMRRLRDFIRYRKLPGPEVHKLKMLNILLPMFPEKKFVLIGDNTQHDLSIYVTIARKYPESVDAIYIRQAVATPHHTHDLSDLKAELRRHNIAFYYGDFVRQPPLRARQVPDEEATM